MLLIKLIEAQNGSIDSSFGIDGITKTAFYGQADVATCVLIQKDSKVVVGGYAYSPSGYQFAVARYQSNGIIDSTFGINGKQTIPFSEGNAFCTCIALQQDGKIVLGGYIQSVFNHEDFALARILPNGQLDYNEFYPGGKSTKDFKHENDRINSVVIQADGKILAIGSSSSNGIIYEYALAQYDKYGFPDLSYGTQGIVTTDFGGEHLSYAMSAAIQSDGKVVVGGYSYNSQASKDFSVARYDQNGKIDSSFGTFGKVIVDFGYSDKLSALAIQPDGKIILAGNSETNSTDDTYILMARLKTKGQLDFMFGTNGKVINRPDYNISVNGLALRENGKLNITGEVSGDIALLQYKNEGVLDSTFGNNGKTIKDWGSDYDKASGIAVQTDGKIVITGVNNPASFCISRYNNVDVFKVAHWLGTSDNNWHNSNNWDNGIIPDVFTDVIINSLQECTITNPAFCRTFKMLPGSNIKVQNSFLIYK